MQVDSEWLWAHTGGSSSSVKTSQVASGFTGLGFDTSPSAI